MLTWLVLQDVLLDVEVALNNRPLSYVEEDPQLPMLIPNTLLFGQPSFLPVLEHNHLGRPQICASEQSTSRYAKMCCGSDGQMSTLKGHYANSIVFAYLEVLCSLAQIWGLPNGYATKDFSG